MIKIILKNKPCLEENLDEGRKDDATNFVKKISPEDTAKKEKYETALTAMLANPIADNKYILWMLKHLEEAPDVDAMMLAVSYYDTFQKNIEAGNPLKDINNIKSFQDLTDVVDDYSKSIKELEREGQKIVVSKEETGGRFEVIRPLNVYASCDLGKNSRWCIAATKSKNYYSNYSTRGIVFYTILDHSKPVKDKNSMFTYAIIQDKKSDSMLTFQIEQNPDNLEIYNAVDDPVKREKVQALIGKDTEEEFFAKMKQESGLGIQSSTQEKYNTFFPRLMKWVRSLKNYDSAYADMSKEDRKSYDDIEDEVREYFEGWKKIAVEGNLRTALRHMVGFTKKAADSDNVQFKYRTGRIIKYDFSDVPELMELLPDLMRNPNWLKDSAKKFKSLYSMDPLHSTLFDKNPDGDERQPEHQLTEFTEQAIYNDKPEYIQELFNKYIDAQKEVGPKELDRMTINQRVDSILKPCVFNIYPPAKEMLKTAIDASPTPIKKLEDIFYAEYGVANFSSRIQMYGNDLIEHCIEKFRDDPKKNKSLTSIIMKTRDLNPQYYKYCLDSNAEPELSLWFGMHNNINVLDLEYQEKIVDGVNKYARLKSGTPYTGSLVATAYFGILRSDSLSKNVLSDTLTRLFRGEYMSLPGSWLKELYEKYGDDPEINSPIFKKIYSQQKGLTERKLFSFNKEYGVYKVIL